MEDAKISYEVREFAGGRYKVWQYKGAVPVNEYHGYLVKGAYFRLYPSRVLVAASGIDLRRHDVALEKTRRGF